MQVAIWKKEDEVAARQLKALEREQLDFVERERVEALHDEGAIKSWLILGPIELPTEENEIRLLEQEQIKEERLLRPTEKHAMNLGGETMIWQVLARSTAPAMITSGKSCSIGATAAPPVCISS